jgi:UDP-N-acetylmuramate dehydrogenase
MEKGLKLEESGYINMDVNVKELLLKFGKVEENVGLAPFTSFKIGGDAQYFFVPFSEEQLLSAIKVLSQTQIPYYILGAGSNILVSSKGVKGVVIKPEFNDFFQVDSNPCYFYVGSSVRFSTLLSICLRESLGGIEFLAGLPASFGGALAMGASFKGKDIFSVVVKVKVLKLQDFTISFVDKDSFSSLNEDIILGGVVSLYPKERQDILDEIKANISWRLKTQDSRFSAGCIFKNPKQGRGAGELIDKAGLKGLKKGGASVSRRHANFIINEKNATSSDVVFLIEEIKEKVYNKFGVRLEEEIERWGC